MQTTKTAGTGSNSERSPQWLNASGIQERIIVRLVLELQTPTHIGSGESDAVLDMPLLRDPMNNQPIISGSTLAGALKAYLAKSDPQAAKNLFGNVGNDNKSRESWVRVGNARLKKDEKSRTELRDGVGINPITRTAGARLKYDLELLQAGSEFEVELELLLPRDHPEYKKDFYRAIQGLNGAIRLGKRKRRGYGEIKIVSGKVWTYQFPKDLVRWLEAPLSEDPGQGQPLKLDQTAASSNSAEEDLLIEVTCTLESGLLIRATPTRIQQGSRNLPDQEMIRSNRRMQIANGKFEQRIIIPGTSMAGVLRARLERIANTLNPGSGKEWSGRLFGQGHQSGGKYTSSRVWVDETIIDQPNEWVHTRVKIDRFTGGAAHGALFSQGLLLPSPKTKFTIKIRLENPQEDEVRMMLLLLKDLWTGDLPVGGESGVGRGRLRGTYANIAWRGYWWKLTGKDHGNLALEANDGAPDLFEIKKSVSGASHANAGA